jgi:ribonuclease HI
MDVQESIYPFPDQVFIQDRISATRYGCTIFQQGVIHRCLVVWVDGSVDKYPPTKGADRLVASAIRYLDPFTKRWIEIVTLNTLHYGAKFALEAEFIAIHEAFRFARGLIDDFDRLVVLSDCQGVLHGMRTGSLYTILSRIDLVAGFLGDANSLYDDGISVELRWVPAHSDVEGNNLVDELATRVRRSAQYLLAQEAPGLEIDQVTTPGSLHSLHQALLGDIVPQAKDERVHDDDLMKKAKD